MERLGYYPNLYYRFLSLFTRDTSRESVATWRVLNALTATLLVAGAVLLSAPRYRRAITVGALVALMLLVGLFLVMLDQLLLLLAAHGRRRVLRPGGHRAARPRLPRLLAARIGFLVLCLVMLVAGRSEGPGIAAILIVVALPLGLQAPRAVYGCWVRAMPWPVPAWR